MLAKLRSFAIQGQSPGGNAAARLERALKRIGTYILNPFFVPLIPNTHLLYGKAPLQEDSLLNYPPFSTVCPGRTYMSPVASYFLMCRS